MQRLLACLLLIFNGFSIIHSYTTTKNSKKIFQICEQLKTIFDKKLNILVDYSKFSKSFSKSYKISFLILMACSLVIQVLSFLKDEKHFYRVIILPFLYFFWNVNMFKLIFFIMVSNIHIIQLKEAALRAHQKINYLNLQTSSNAGLDHQIHDFTTMREIHGRIWEMSNLINKTCGPTILILIICVVLGNSAGGYNLFLYERNVIGVGEAASTKF